MASKKTSDRTITDNTIREIALRIVAEEGPDALSLPRVAAVGGLTSGPLYRRFDTGADLASDLWRADIGPYFRRVATTAVDWLTGDSTDAEWLTRDLLEPGLQPRALIGLLVVARRLGPQGEDVSSDIRTTLERSLDEAATLPPPIVIAHMAPIIGAWLLEPISDVLSGAVVSERAAFAEEYRKSKHWAMSSADIPYQPPSPPTLASGDPTMDDLRSATVRVVSRYGCAGATSNRISREADRSITPAYRRLGSKEGLIADSIGAALSLDFGFTASPGAAAMPFSKADRLTRMLQVLRNQIHSDNRANRAFLIECLLAARHEPLIKANARHWIENAGSQFREAVQRLGLADERVSSTLQARWGFRIASGLGGLVLSMAAPSVFDRLDPMPVTSASDTVGLAPIQG